MKTQSPRGRTRLNLSIGFWAGLLLLALLAVSANARAQTFPFVVWVFDKGVRDSQFGYYNGVVSQAIGRIYADYDVEGLSCVAETIYATSGGDGRVPSRLFTLTLDLANGRSQLSEIASLRAATGEALYEVSSLTTRSDQTLWGYAAEGDLTGILQIDPATGVATLVEPAALDVAAVAWLGDTLWLGARDQLYSWTPGAAITPAFKVTGIRQIEALDVINNLLYLGGDNITEAIVLDPTTGQRLRTATFAIPNDIEGFTFCPAFQPPATATATATSTLTPTSSPTPTSTTTPTATPTPSATLTATPTPPATFTATATPTATATEVGDVELTETPTPTPTASATPPTPPAVVTVTLPPPTALEVASFRSMINGQGLDLSWETNIEVETVGFYLWRSSAGRDQAMQISPGFIAAQGNRSSGAAYQFHDNDVTSGVTYTYWLEAVRADGTVNETLSIVLTFARPLYLPYLRR